MFYTKNHEKLKHENFAHEIFRSTVWNFLRKVFLSKCPNNRHLGTKKVVSLASHTLHREEGSGHAATIKF